MNGPVRTILLLFLLSAGKWPLMVQEDDGTVLRVETRLVQVDVVVRDDGRPVTDLVREDFRIFDNGQEQEIAVFDVIQAEVPSETSPLPEGVVSNRHDRSGSVATTATAILVDRINTSREDQLYVDYQVREFLKKANPGDRLALYELSGPLRVVHDFTADPELLIRAAEDMRPGQTLEVPGDESLANEGLDPRLVEFVTGGSFDPGAEADRQRAATYFEIRANDTASALQAIARHMADLPGRKNLVWFATSFPITYNPRQHLDFTEANMSLSTLEHVHETVVLLNETNLAVYPVYARGIVGPISNGLGLITATQSPGNLDLMLTLAEMTGGRVYTDNGFVEAIQESIEDTRVSYRLGFYPPAAAATDASFHELEVSVDRRGVDVQHRNGYFGFGETDRVDRAMTLAELLTSPMAAASLGLLGKAATTDAAAGGYEVTLSVDVRDLSLEFEDGLLTGALEVAMLWVDGEDGTVRLLPDERFPIEMTEELFQTALDTGLFITKPIGTDGRSGGLRIAVREPATGVGGAIWVPLGADSGGPGSP